MFLFTVVTGAQIGTSQPEISIMQIDSMTIKRTTWITEEIQNDQESTLKIIKGTAIISERYVQEADLIALGLIKSLNIEKKQYPKHKKKY